MKKKYFYFDCDTTRGRMPIGVEVEDYTFGCLLEAEHDLKHIILEPCERVIGQLVRKPRGLSWDTFRKPWCLGGYKSEDLEVNRTL